MLTPNKRLVPCTGQVSYVSLPLLDRYHMYEVSLALLPFVEIVLGFPCMLPLISYVSVILFAHLHRPKFSCGLYSSSFICIENLANLH